jgi:hypothetical protein
MCIADCRLYEIVINFVKNVLQLYLCQFIRTHVNIYDTLVTPFFKDAVNKDY